MTIFGAMQVCVNTLWSKMWIRANFLLIAANDVSSMSKSRTPNRAITTLYWTNTRSTGFLISTKHLSTRFSHNNLVFLSKKSQTMLLWHKARLYYCTGNRPDQLWSVTALVFCFFFGILETNSKISLDSGTVTLNTIDVYYNDMTSEWKYNPHPIGSQHSIVRRNGWDYLWPTFT